MEAKVIFQCIGFMIGLAMSFEHIRTGSPVNSIYKAIQSLALITIPVAIYIFFFVDYPTWAAYYWLSILCGVATFHLLVYLTYYIPFKIRVRKKNRNDNINYLQLLMYRFDWFDEMLRLKLSDNQKVDIPNVESSISLITAPDSPMPPETQVNDNEPMIAMPRFDMVEFIKNEQLVKDIKENTEGKKPASITTSILHKYLQLQKELLKTLDIDVDEFGYIGFALYKIQCLFFYEGASSFTIRERNLATDWMETKFSTRGEDNIPGDIPLNEASLILKSHDEDLPMMYSENRKEHYQTKPKAETARYYDDYLTQCLISKDGKPYLSYCIDVSGTEACKTLKLLMSMGVFSWIKLVTNNKLRIIANRKTTDGTDDKANE